MIFDSKIPLFQEAIYLFERWKDMFNNFSIYGQIKGFHVHKETAIGILQQVVEIEQSEVRGGTKCTVTLETKNSRN